MYQGKHIKIDDFSGGYCGNLSFDSLEFNQAMDCDNIVIAPDKKGWRKRNIGTKENASALNSGARIHGIYVYNAQGGSKMLFAVSGTKIYTHEMVTGGQPYNDRTGTVTLAFNAPSCLYTLFPFGSKIIGFGGSQGGGSDTPWEIDTAGSSNAAVLTGSPPSAYGGFAANNRVFAFNTTTSPDKIYWSVLANENDWTSAGSGSAVVGQGDTGDPVMAAAVLNTNTVLLFKKSSTYRMVITSAPFPIYNFISDIGCCGKNATIVINGVAYWIDLNKRMHSTDGQSIQEYPPNADDLWNTMFPAAMYLTLGFREKGADYDWLVWTYFTSGTDQASDRHAIVWDLINKCWLRNSTGYYVRCTAYDYLAGITYCGTSNGYIIKMGLSSTGTDDSDSTTPVPYWRSGWIQPSSSEDVIQVKRLTLNCDPTSGTINLKYGFNFLADTVTTTISAAATSTELLEVKRTELTGRGNYFQYYIGLSSDATNTISVSGILLSGKVYGQKRISA